MFLLNFPRGPDSTDANLVFVPHVKKKKQYTKNRNTDKATSESHLFWQMDVSILEIRGDNVYSKLYGIPGERSP